MIKDLLSLNSPKLFGNFTGFVSKKFKCATTSYHFPKEYGISKNVYIRLWEVGAKRRLNATSKENTWTNGHFDL